MRRKWDIVCLALVLAVGVWGIMGLWKLSGLPTSHDSISHMARMYAYEEGLRDGVFPVLWARRMFWGIGSPVLMLNYQVPYYFSMLWHSLGLTLDQSFKAVLSFSQIASGLFMYFALRQRFKYIPSLVGAILYMITPYRFLNIYVRGAIGEVFATMFPPLILSGMWRASLPLQTLGWAGLFLSHPVGSALYSGVFWGYTLLVDRWQNIVVALKKFFVPYLLAFMIAAFNLLPTLALTHYTYYSPANTDTLHNFPTLNQLVYSNWGYGFSTDDDYDQMSFQIGAIQWFLATATLAFIIRRKQKDSTVWEMSYFLCVFVGAVLLMLKPLATPVYTYLGLGKIIDYPWRILMIFSFVTAMMSARLVALIRVKRAAIVLALFLTTGALYTNRNHIRINAIWPWPSDGFAHGTGDAFGEYAARYRVTREGSLFYELAEYIEGSGTISVTSDRSNETAITAQTSEPAVVRFNIMYFPGWVARINGKSIPIDTEKNSDSSHHDCYVTSRLSRHVDDSGLIACHILPGTHVLSLTYEPLPIQRFGNLISLAGILTLLWYMYRSFYLRLTKPRR